jgi:hypothetical protein
VSRKLPVIEFFQRVLPIHVEHELIPQTKFPSTEFFPGDNEASRRVDLDQHDFLKEKLLIIARSSTK